jgi:hypothetical protein
MATGIQKRKVITLGGTAVACPLAALPVEGGEGQA